MENKYPLVQRDYFNPIINRMLTSFKTPEIKVIKTLPSSLIGKWNGGDNYELQLTDTNFDGNPYVVKKIDKNYFTIEVTESNYKFKYLIILVKKDLMMLYLYNEVNKGFSGGSELYKE